MSKIAKLAFPAPPAHRPYWHVDAKWVCGLIFALGLGLSLNLFALWRLTAPEIAVPAATEVVASMFSPKGLDDTTDIEAFRQMAATQPGDVVRPLEGRDVTITKQELATLPPRELRLKIFRQVVEPFYIQGVDGLAAQAATPEEGAKIKQQAGALRLLNRQTHDRLGELLKWTVGVTVLFLVGLIGFSWHWGRLASPGLVMVLTALPGALFLLVVASAAGGGGGPVQQLSPTLTRSIAQALLWPFGLVAGIGLLGLFAAGMGRLIARRRA